MPFAVSVITPEVRGEAPLALLSGSFDERLAKAAELGYAGIELVVCEPERLEPRQIRELLAKHGLAAAAAATGFLAKGYGLTLTAPEAELRRAALRRLEELIRFSAAVGSGIVTIGSFRGRADAAGGLASAEEKLHHALAAVEPLCLELGVCLALEPIHPGESDFLTDAEQTCRFLDRGGHRAAALLLDSYHVFRAEPEPLKTFGRYRDRLRHVHLADSERRAVGGGSIDFAAMERELERLGYAGWQSAELARADDPDGNARRTVEYLRGLRRAGIGTFSD